MNEKDKAQTWTALLDMCHDGHAVTLKYDHHNGRYDIIAVKDKMCSNMAISRYEVERSHYPGIFMEAFHIIMDRIQRLRYTKTKTHD